MVEAWLVQDWCGGGCLRDVFPSGAFAGAHKALEAGLQLADAVRTLHEAGVVHGDLCPEWSAPRCPLSEQGRLLARLLPCLLRP